MLCYFLDDICLKSLLYLDIFDCYFLVVLDKNLFGF